MTTSVRPAEPACTGCADLAAGQAAELRAKLVESDRTLDTAIAEADAARSEAAYLREQLARLKNELLGVAQDIDGDCVGDVDGCECGGDGSVCGEALEAGCARCWATRLRQVADGVAWPPRVLDP